jgi:hypothetical protein
MHEKIVSVINVRFIFEDKIMMECINLANELLYYTIFDDTNDSDLDRKYRLNWVRGS